jgi:hypothetical protein
MQMLMIAFRSSLEEQILALLKRHDVAAYTEVYKVHGTGEAGSTSGGPGSVWPISNSVLLIALSETQTDAVVAALQQFHAEWEGDPQRPKLPLRGLHTPLRSANLMCR